MDKHRTKTCCHCGSETHPQPQDHNHDTGYGHCHDCLKKENWYVRSFDQLADNIRVDWFEARDTNNGPLTSDDSHAKVVEVYVRGKLDYHQTLHMTKDKIRGLLKAKYLRF